MVGYSRVFQQPPPKKKLSIASRRVPRLALASPATITTLPSRSSESGDVTELHDRKISAAQNLEAGSERDSFVAETAIKIDRLQETNRLLVSDVAELVVKVASLQEACALEARWYGFHQAEKRAGESKLDEMVRHYRDLKVRLDKVEARPGATTMLTETSKR